MKEPNIFNFATSELSQDAFICWLLSCWSSNSQKELSTASKDFIISLYNKNQNTNFSNSCVADVYNIKQQYYKIDVYFEATINNETVSFIIEDKTWTSVHSDQLKKYFDTIKQKKPNNKIVTIYYKTGYLYHDDIREAQKEKYSIIDSKWMYEFLKAFCIDHPIFVDYREYIYNSFYIPFSQIGAKLTETDSFKEFEKSYFQYEFMKMLITKCPDSINTKDNFKYSNNLGGTPWTQYDFVQLDGIYENDESEYLFYRIDKRLNPENNQRNFYLRINQYAYLGKEPIQKYIDLKKVRLNQYRDLFKSINTSGLHFSIPSNKGLNESEIAILFFDSSYNCVNNVLKYIPIIHKEFVNSIKTSNLVP